MNKKPNPYSERMTVNLSPNQMLRDAVNYYLASQEDLPGSRRAIAKGVESKVDVLDAKVEALTTQFTDFINSIRRRREG